MLELDPPRKADVESEDSESGDSESGASNQGGSIDGLGDVENQVQNLSVAEGTKSKIQDWYYHHNYFLAVVTAVGG